MISIAIDGPAGAGKSTISRALAKELGYVYVDTGALYRAVGLHMLRHDIRPGDREKVPPELDNVKVELCYSNGTQHVILDGEDVYEAIRSPEVSMAASDVSAIPAVRSFLFDLQKNMAKTNNIVMDGRDIGTVVLPDAQIKIFLTASAEDRARRRYNEMISKGQEADFNAVLEDIKQRDYNDSHRDIAPLKQAADAALIDTSGNTLEQSVKQLTDYVRLCLAKI
jgi:cytidylate kinase